MLVFCCCCDYGAAACRSAPAIILTKLHRRCFSHLVSEGDTAGFLYTKETIYVSPKDLGFRDAQCESAGNFQWCKFSSVS